MGDVNAIGAILGDALPAAPTERPATGAQPDAGSFDVLVEQAAAALLAAAAGAQPAQMSDPAAGQAPEGVASTAPASPPDALAALTASLIVQAPRLADPLGLISPQAADADLAGGQPSLAALASPPAAAPGASSAPFVSPPATGNLPASSTSDLPGGADVAVAPQPAQAPAVAPAPGEQQVNLVGRGAPAGPADGATQAASVQSATLETDQQPTPAQPAVARPAQEAPQPLVAQPAQNASPSPDASATAAASQASDKTSSRSGATATGSSAASNASQSPQDVSASTPQAPQGAGSQVASTVDSHPVSQAAAAQPGAAQAQSRSSATAASVDGERAGEASGASAATTTAPAADSSVTASQKGDAGTHDGERRHGNAEQASAPRIDVPSATAQPTAQVDQPARPVESAPVRVPVLDQVVQGIRLAHSEGHSEIFLKLDPPSLGELQVRLTVHNDQVQVHLHTASGEVKGLLDSALTQLRQALTDQGLRVEGLQVSLGQGGSAGFGSGAGGARDGAPSRAQASGGWLADSEIAPLMRDADRPSEHMVDLRV